jgi:hypothetical protein
MGKNRMQGRAPNKKIPSATLNDYTYGWDGMTRDMMREEMTPGLGWTAPNGGTCGTGSTKQSTAPLVAPLKQLLKDYKVESFADVGAGDRRWITMIPFNDIHYEAFDLIPREASVQSFDVTSDILARPFDVVMTRFVLNHLSAKLVRDALHNLQASGSKYLLCSVPNTAQKRFANIAHAQAKYWQEFDIVLPDPLVAIPDANSWCLSLFELESIELPTTR